MPRVGSPIEHLMPRSRLEHWPVDGLSEEIERSAHINSLGNLTLIRKSLNSSISNGPWLGAKGKRSKLEPHDVFLMNRRIRLSSEEAWDETRIDERTKDLVERLISTCPTPAGHHGVISSGSLPAQVVSMQELLASGLMEANTVPKAPRDWAHRPCTVLHSGDFLLSDGTRYGSPSGAGRQVLERAVNEWTFGRLPDGRQLSELRKQYRQSQILAFDD